MISFNGFFFVFPFFFFFFQLSSIFSIFYLLFFFKTYIWIRFYPPILLFIKHAILTHQSISHFFLTFFQFLFPIERPHRQYALNSPKPDPFPSPIPVPLVFPAQSGLDRHHYLISALYHLSQLLIASNIPLSLRKRFTRPSLSLSLFIYFFF